MKFVFETPHRDSEGKPHRVSTWPYTVSLNEKANLRKDLEKWRGRKFSADELNGFDLESVIGAPAMLNIVHNEGDEGQVYANVNGIFADRNAQKYRPTGDYVRKAATPSLQDEPETVVVEEEEPCPF